MEFNSAIFLFCFFPIAFLGYYLVSDKLKNYWLLAASIVFYAWGEPQNVFIIALSVFVNYYLGLSMAAQTGKTRSVIFIVTLVLNLSAVAWYKIYAAMSGGVPPHSVGMPIGMLLFTLRVLSYQIDLYKDEIQPQKNLAKLMLYVMLFPQMIAGPVIRYGDIAQQLDDRAVTMDGVYRGMLRFMAGFSKKILIADTMAKAADYAFNNIGVSGALSWLGTICFMLQIYYEFSGYSDMAIGMGRMAGFTFEENFRFPYAARSVREFWSRWYISISSWVRDYLYIPLGGSHKGKVRTCVNILIVFLLTGLWHGSNYNFIVLALFHGLFLCLEHACGKKAMSKVPGIIGHIYTLLVVLIGWVLLRTDTLQDAVNVLWTMVAPGMWNWNAALPVMNTEMIVFFVCGIAFMFGVHKKVSELFNTRLEIIKSVAVLCVYGVAIIYTIISEFNPFMYFSF